MKPVVHYRPVYGCTIAVNENAIVEAVDHYDPNITSDRPAVTSRVVAYDPDTGEFETLNTKYVPYVETN